MGFLFVFKIREGTFSLVRGVILPTVFKIIRFTLIYRVFGRIILWKR